MPRQITILETVKSGDGITNVTAVQWFPIAAQAARVPIVGAKSRLSVLTGAAAITPAEQAALDDGSVREETIVAPFPLSATNAQIKAQLVLRYTDRATAIAAEPPTRQWFGVSYDGSAWSA